MRFSNLVGKPEPQKFLVDGLIPIGKPGILAAVGGVGKSLKCHTVSVSGGVSWCAGGGGKMLKNMVML